MSQISPPIRIVLVAAVAFLAAWMLFLRPTTDTGSPAAAEPVATTTPVDAGGETAQSGVGKVVESAKDAAATAETAAKQAAGEETTGTAGAPAKPAQAAQAAPPTAEEKALTAAGLPARVEAAIADEKVVVLLFWSPAAAEDKAVRDALDGIDRHDGEVVAHAAHVKRIAQYQSITRGAGVDQSPTVLVIDRERRVTPLVGYVDRGTIDQAVSDALRAR